MKLFIIFTLLLTLEVINIKADQPMPEVDTDTATVRPDLLSVKPETSAGENSNTGVEKPPTEGSPDLPQPKATPEVSENFEENTGDLDAGAENDKSAEKDVKPVASSNPPVLDTDSGDNNTSNEPNNDFDGMSTKCQANINHCYGTSSPVEDIKGKSLKSDGGCDHLAAGKTCLTTDHSGNNCTDEEYSKMQKATCFCPRAMASVVVVAVLSILSKMLSL